MKTRTCAWALPLMALAGSAEAKGFAWCQVSSAKYDAYLSAIVEIEDGPEAFRALASGPFGKGFQDYVRAKFDPAASAIDCNRQDSLFFAEDYIDVQINANPGYRFVKTGWDAKPASASADHARRASGGGRGGTLRHPK